MSERIRYSEKIPGSFGNYEWPVRFDSKRGFVGISQDKGDPRDDARILLSPAQVKALFEFAYRKKRKAMRKVR